MKNFLLLMVVALTLSTEVYGQKVTYVGDVTDSTGYPLQFANVMAMDTVKNTIASFGVTNENGGFKLFLEDGKPYRLKVSFIGFLPFEAMITASDNADLPLLIRLQNSSTQLGDVEVVSEMPVLIQGDTITYKTDAFIKGNERKLGDVLEELPGFEVNDDGQVSVQGKQVGKLLVDGKEAFGGDTKLMTQNLPANVVDKVQVLQNFNDVAPLGGVNQSNQTALNILLKEDKKNILFGDATLGAGPEDRYLGHLNGFYYNEKTSLNLIGGANNIGQLTFTMSDYFRFSGGFANLARSVGSNIRTGSEGLGFPTAERNNAQDLSNELGAFSYNFTPGRKWSISGFAIGSSVDNTLGSVSQRSYVLQTGDNQELLTSSTNVRSNAGLFKLGAKFIPNPNLQLDYEGMLRVSDSENTTIRDSEFRGTNNIIGGVNSQQPWSIKNQLRGFYAKGDRDVFSLEATYEHKFQDPLFDLSTTERPFASLITLANDNPYNILQFKEITTDRQEAVLNYYRILNKTNHINFKVGNVYTSQRLTSNLSQRLAQGNVVLNDPALGNDVDFQFEDYYAGITYKTKMGRLTFSPSLNLHYYNIQNRQLGQSEGFDKTLLLPSALFNYSIGSGHSLIVNYSAQAEFTDVENLSRGLIVRNYNSLFGGNPALKNSFYHNVAVNYMNYNMYSFFSIFGGLNYSKRFDAISNIIQFSGLERVNSPINIDLANETFSGNIRADKRFNGFSINGSGRITRSLSNNFISDIPNENVSLQQTYELSLDTRLFKALNLEIGYEKIFNNYEGNNAESEFQNDRPFVDLDVSFLNGFRFDLTYEYNNYRNVLNGVTSNFAILDAELTYRMDKTKWEFKAQGMNLLNTTGVRRDSFSESLISTYEYFIQKRYWLFSVMYDL